VANTVTTIRPVYYPDLKGVSSYDPELEPYASLFLKPLTNKKCTFSKKELEVMCKDPLHSPRLILYLIDFVKEL
jgi:hypothetical protein